jgi:hypothetical protein
LPFFLSLSLALAWLLLLYLSYQLARNRRHKTTPVENSLGPRNYCFFFIAQKKKKKKKRPTTLFLTQFLSASARLCSVSSAHHREFIFIHADVYQTAGGDGTQTRWKGNTNSNNEKENESSRNLRYVCTQLRIHIKDN